MTVCSKLQTLGTILTVGWALKSLVAYHTWTIDEVMEDVASSPLPLNENGLDYWRNTVAVAAYYDIGPVKKQAKMRMHTVVTTCIAIGLCIQFMQIVRTKYIDLHRYVGRLTLALTLIVSTAHCQYQCHLIILTTAFDYHRPFLISSCSFPVFPIKLPNTLSLPSYS